MSENGSEYSISELLDSINADILIIGDSKAACSYSTLVFDSLCKMNVCNLGVSGQPYGFSILRYNVYRKHNKKPHLIIINADKSEFDLIVKDFESNQFLPYLNNEDVKPYAAELGFSLLDLYFPMYKYIGNYKLIAFGFAYACGIMKSNRQHYKGYYNGNTPFDDSDFKKHMQTADSIYDTINPTAIKILTRFIEQNQSDSINMIFIQAPTFDKLQQHISMYRQQFIYDSLSVEYSIPQLNFTTLEWTSDSSYFYNPNHVNIKGAELFSTIITDTLQLKK